MSEYNPHNDVELEELDGQDPGHDGEAPEPGQEAPLGLLSAAAPTRTLRDAEATARSAEGSTVNLPGYCLQWSRLRAGIGSRYGDAATAWSHVSAKHTDREAPRGSLSFWTGGSHGYGHIAVNLGHARVRSTDAGGKGRVATVVLDWPETHWGLRWAGWSWEVNGITIPHGDDAGRTDNEEDDMPLTDKEIEKIAAKVWSHQVGKDKTSVGTIMVRLNPGTSGLLGAVTAAVRSVVGK